MVHVARRVSGIVLCVSFAVGAAGGFLDQPVRILSPFPPGGGTDLPARAGQDTLAQARGTVIVLDDRSRAGNPIGCARAASDGHTLLVTSASCTFAPSIYKDLPHDAEKDFRPITQLA